MSIEGNIVNMKCEHLGCDEEKGQDYFRLKSEEVKGWEGEPIYLCDKHSEGHIKYPNTYPNKISNQNN